MITVPQVVEEKIKASPYLLEAIGSDLINLSQLARILKPEIDKELYKNVSIASIVMALKRQSKHIKTQSRKYDFGKMLGDISVRSNLMELTFANSPTLLNNLKGLLAKTPDDVFLTWTRGVYETTVIASNQIESEVDKLFKSESLKFRIPNLSTLTIKLPDNNIEIPGVYYYVLKLLAWEGINLIEAVSTATELTIVLKTEDVNRAFGLFSGKQ